MSRDRQHQREDEIAHEVLGYIEASPCATPLALSTLEQLAVGATSPEDTDRVQTHLGQCLYCLSAFTRVQSLLESPSPAAYMQSLVDSIEQGRPINETTEPVVSRLQEEVQKIVRTIGRTARTFLHRATQQVFSDPALSDDPAPAYMRFALSARVEESTPTADASVLLDRLSLAIRVTEESLEQMHTLRHLLTETQAVQARIENAEMPAPIKRAFRARLASECQVVDEFVRRAAAFSGRTFR